jgi:branched-subunit amino acid transport protein
MSDIVLILAVALATYAIRVSFVTFLAGWTFHPWLQRSITYVRPAAMAALLVTVLASHAAIDPPHVAAIGVAAWIAHRRAGLVAPLAAGMAVLAALTHLP